MDRRLTYTGAVPLDLDFLQPQRAGMVGLGKLAETLFGTESVIDGLAVVPTQPATRGVRVEPGQIYVPAALDAIAYGSLAADTAHQVVKQGLMLDPLTVAITPPGTPGYAQRFLLQAAFQERDEGATVLPYYNAAKPDEAWAGPANSGQAQYTERNGRIVIQVKAGAPAPSGSEAAPTPDAGWVGLAIVRAVNGQATISAADITPYSPDRRLAVKLPALGRTLAPKITTVTAARTLTPDDAGLIIVDCGLFSGSFDIRLPLASAAPGQQQRFIFSGRKTTLGAGFGFARILPSGSDRLDILASGQAMYLGPGDNFTLISDGGGAWQALGSKGSLHHMLIVTAPQTIPSGVETAVNFTANFGAALWWNAADPTAIVVPQTVRARFNANLRFDPNPNGTRYGLVTLAAGAGRGDGLPLAEQTAAASRPTVVSMAGGPIGLPPGTRVQLLAYQDSGGPLTLQAGHTWMSMEIVV